MEKIVSNEVDECRVVVLVDNRHHPQYKLEVEHGLSFHIRVGSENYLFDVGASDAFYHNAEKLGIAIEQVDALFISHGHRDHTGGLPTFLEVNSKAKIYLSEELKGKSLYSDSRGPLLNITMPRDFTEEERKRFVFVDKDQAITPQLEIFTYFYKRYPQPLANETMYSKEFHGEVEPDCFDHELALKLKLKQGVVVLSACTHNGLLNTIETLVEIDEREDLLATIGGTHLLDDYGDYEFETEEELDSIAQNLLEVYPNMRLITGHCTGRETMEKLRQKMDNQFEMFHSGWFAHY